MTERAAHLDHALQSSRPADDYAAVGASRLTDLDIWHR